VTKHGFHLEFFTATFLAFAIGSLYFYSARAEYPDIRWAYNLLTSLFAHKIFRILG